MVFCLASDDKIWFENTALFGAEVANAFPSATIDIKEAGTCFALGRYTAANFHAMCALEPAFRALAANVGVKWTHKTVWGTAINDIENKIKSLKITKANQNQLTFLSQAASQFKHFKDGWRNGTMHARGQGASQLEAKLVLVSVKEFMILLSSRLKERGRKH